jgi:hypothetical protein
VSECLFIFNYLKRIVNFSFEEAFALLIREIETIRKDVISKDDHSIYDKSKPSLHHQASIGFSTADSKRTGNGLSVLFFFQSSYLFWKIESSVPTSSSSIEKENPVDWNIATVQKWLERCGLSKYVILK